ncbi:hypothetical protein ACFL1Y_00320, partial [Patescibacteria group bacterium]
MKVGIDKNQKILIQAFQKKKIKLIKLDLRGKNWVKKVQKSKCDVFVWDPALHHRWFKLLDRAVFLENFLEKKIFPKVKDSYLFQDKFHQKYIFDYYKISYPKTEIIVSAEELNNYVKKVKYPFLIKDSWGFGGDAPKLKNLGIEIIKNKKQAQDFIKRKKWPKWNDWINLEDYVYAQELVDIKHEFRVITIGQKIIASYERKSPNVLKHIFRG